jgi:hypothetical protein
MSPNVLPDPATGLREIVLGVLDVVRARSVVLVGNDPCAMPLLEEWRDTRGADVSWVDSLAASDVSADAYVLTGDRNYFTVSHQLELLAGAVAHSPVAFVAGAGWPTARRDAYTRPHELPTEAVHPYSRRKGISLGTSGVTDGASNGDGHLLFAAREGGPRNGVLTALEDFVRIRKCFELRIVPGFTGLAILFLGSAPHADRLREHLEPWDDNPMLSRLEEDRLRLLILAREAEDRLRAQRTRRHRVTALREELEAVQRSADEEIVGLKARIAGFQARISELQTELGRLARSSRWLRALEFVERPVRVWRPGLGTVRQRLLRMRSGRGSTRTASVTTTELGHP